MLKKRYYLMFSVILSCLMIISFFIFSNSNERKKEQIKSDKDYKMSCNYLELGEYVKAHEFAMFSYTIEKRNKQSKRYAETLNLLGNIYEKTGLYIKALETHYESLELQKSNRNDKGIANSYHNIAHINLMAGRYDNAYNYYKNALEIYENLYVDSTDSIEVGKNVSKIYLSIGNYFISQKDSVQAFNYLNKALFFSKKHNDKLGVAQSFLYLGNSYFQYNNYLKAEDYYLKSLDVNIKEKNKIGIVINKINLGRIYYITNRINESIDVLNYVLGIATKISAGKQIAEASELLYSIYSGMPDSIEQTKKYAAIFLESKRYLPNEMMQDSILQMSVRYEVTAKKNQEILLQNFKIKIRTIFFISLIGVLLIVTVFIYYHNKLKQRAQYEKKLLDEKLLRYREVLSAIEKERKRIAIDLHDSLGQLLTASKLNLSSLEDQHISNNKLYTDTVKLLDQSSEELRNISFNIMPAALIKYGLKSAIEEIIHRINNNKTEINFKSNGFEKPLNKVPEIIIYRIVQEILNNIMKHANASTVNIHLGKDRNITTLSIDDNGIGMEDFESYKNRGLGWKSVFSRVEMLNGNIKVKTKANKGTKIHIVFPDNDF